MKKNLFFIALLLFAMSNNVWSQISYGGTPRSFSKNNLSQKFENKSLPYLDVEALLAEDEANVGKPVPYRFGKDIDVHYNLYNSGTWETLDNGDRIWRLGISSENAHSLNFICNEFFIPEGADMFVYSQDKDIVLGSFNHKNNNDIFSFATTIIPSSNIVIEYFEPAELKNQGRINISKVIHGYRNLFKRGPFGNSASCNININCPLGDNWQDEKRGVAIIVTSNNNAVCTGTMVNNTNEDGTPYFLTANHCLSNATPNWVFIFNHESETCNGNTGPTAHSIHGASVVASDSPSDFALLLLSEEPPADYNVYYCGWSREDVVVNQTVGIHHPAGDIKKICLNTDPTESSNYSSGYSNTHWTVDNWEEGTTEGGSSGSALFDPNHRIIGQLHGGHASCTNLSWDKYGKIAYSWSNNNNSNPSKRLKDWLDPKNSDVLTLDGRYLNEPEFAIDAALSAIVSPHSGENCSSEIIPIVKIRNNGENVLEYVKIVCEVDGSQQTYDWNGSLNFGSSTNVNLNSMQISDGNHNMVIYLTNPNHQTDMNNSNDTISIIFSKTNGIDVTVSVLTDNSPQETSWVLRKDDGTVIFTNPSLSSSETYEQSACLPNGCYDFVIYDTGGDGLSGLFGFLFTGEYALSVDNELTAISPENGNFGSVDSIRFCIDNVNIVENQLDKILIYPNPVYDNLNIEFIGNISDAKTIEIMDISGRIVAKQSVNNVPNIRINTSQLQAGSYFVLIRSSQGVVRKQFIKSN